MDTIVINIQDKSNVKFILDLVKKIGEKGRVLTKTEQEDFLFAEMMAKSKTGEKVSREEIFKNFKLKKNTAYSLQ